ncbi:MAG: hypothetical protein KDD67_08620 [Ignavibacteriae bacterium]|nr:hypothetical protein [Ignavibacteriota bacterium]MCB9216731.1 hypothetical protein [Ignavibacteria bacterium]
MESTSEMQRGVENPDIIDLITPDPTSGEVVLLIIEERPWGSDKNQLVQFDEKLNRYLAYILDGFLGRQYPQYENTPVRIQIDCVDEPTDERSLRFLEGVGMVCEQNGIGFRVRTV